MKKREMMQYGYKAFTGVVFPDIWVDSYNYIQGEINACIDARITPSEELLNRSHFLFNTFAMVDKI